MPSQINQTQGRASEIQPQDIYGKAQSICLMYLQQFVKYSMYFLHRL